MNLVRGLLLSWYLKHQVTDTISHSQQNSHAYSLHISTENRCVRNCILCEQFVHEQIVVFIIPERIIVYIALKLDI